jgi:manganese/zinc/iron transport system permease protein
MIEIVMNLIFDPNMRWVVTACVLLGISSGILGCFALLKKYSLMGDAVAHAALPGICIAFMLYGSKSMSIFLLGAMASGLLGALVIQFISKHSRIKPDTALGIVLSGFFGFGIVLLTKISQSGQGSQSGLDAFLFGKAASLVGTDVQVMAVVAVVLISLSFLLFKEFKLLSFDPQFGRGLGLPMGLLNNLLMLMIVLTVVIGLQAVGVVLMAALLITPAIAARYWTENLSHMVLISAVVGALSGVAGTLISAITPNLPTGPVIVLAATAIFLFSMFFAPKRGLTAKFFRLYQVRNRVGRENLLQSLYDLSERDYVDKNQLNLGYTIEQLQTLRQQSDWELKHHLTQLKKSGLIGLVESAGDNRLVLTEEGFKEAYHVTLNQRLYDMLLIYQQRFGGLSIDVETTRIQHEVSEELLHELMELLHKHQRRPQLTPSMSIDYRYLARTYKKEYKYTSASSRGGDV